MLIDFFSQDQNLLGTSEVIFPPNFSTLEYWIFLLFWKFRLLANQRNFPKSQSNLYLISLSSHVLAKKQLIPCHCNTNHNEWEIYLISSLIFSDTNTVSSLICASSIEFYSLTLSIGSSIKLSLSYDLSLSSLSLTLLDTNGNELQRSLNSDALIYTSPISQSLIIRVNHLQGIHTNYQLQVTQYPCIRDSSEPNNSPSQ